MENIPKSENENNNPILEKWKLFISGTNFQPTVNGFLSYDLDEENFHYSKYWFKDYQDGLNNLENGYRSIPLKEVVEELRRGSPFKQAKDGVIPYIAPAAVRSMKISEEGLSFAKSDDVPTKAVIANKDDVLVNIIGTQRGSTAIVTDDFDKMGINHHLVILRPNLKLVRPYYLAIALNSDYVQKQLQEGSKGTVIPALSLKSFESLYIPIPPFYIQDKVCEQYNNVSIKLNQKRKELNNQKLELKNILLNLGKEGLEE